jgi:hypothetical protein
MYELGVKNNKKIPNLLKREHEIIAFIFPYFHNNF